MQRNSNVAYDFDRYDNRKRKPDLVQKEKPVINQVATTNVSRKKTTSIFFILVVILIAITLAFSVLYTIAKRTEISDKIAAAEMNLKEVQAEKSKLYIDLENFTSIKEIEKRAKSLGMVKSENNPPILFKIKKEDEFKVVNKLPETIWHKAQNFLNDIFSFFD